MVVYVAGPYRAPTVWQVTRNIERAREAGLEVAKLGAVPLVPHMTCALYDGEQSDEFFLAAALELLRRSDVVLVLPGWERSSGTRGEIAEAGRRRIPVLFSVDGLRTWLAGDTRVVNVEAQL